MFELKIAILTALLGLVLVGIWYEEKLITFEKRIYDRFCDRVGYILAQIVIRHRRHRTDKSLIKIEEAYDTIQREENKLKKLRGVNGKANNRESV